MNSPTDLFDEHEAARRLGLSVSTMRRRRLLRQPPSWVKLGGRVLYRSVELDAFVDSNVVQLIPTPRRRDERQAGGKRRRADG
jgi:hypothetical protein